MLEDCYLCWDIPNKKCKFFETCQPRLSYQRRHRTSADWMDFLSGWWEAQDPKTLPEQFRSNLKLRSGKEYLPYRKE